MDFVDRSFISQIEHSLPRLRERGEDYNFRCPFCGDSRKSETKMRGWLTWDKESRAYNYHCYNCSKSCGLLELIRHVRPSLADSYIAEKFKAGRGRRVEDDRGLRRAITAKPVFERGEGGGEPEAPSLPLAVTAKPVFARPSTPTLDTTEAATGSRPPFPRFPDVTTIFDNEWALEYAASRLIPFEELSHVFAVEDIRDIASRIEAYKDTKFRRSQGILFPYYNPDGSLGYLQARTQLETLRYVTFEVQGGAKMWGRHRVKPGVHIYLFEGAMDAICIPGAVASGGVDLIRAAHLIKEEYPDNTFSLVYDGDWTSNIQVYNQVVRAVEQGFKVTLTNGPGKDVNAMLVKGGWDVPRVLQMLDECTYDGLRAKLMISKTRKPWKPNSSTATTSLQRWLKA